MANEVKTNLQDNSQSAHQPEQSGDVRLDNSVEARRTQIQAILSREGKVRVLDLSRSFNISAVTIRNDLAEMERAGLVERVHGGAVSTNKSYYNMSDKERMVTHEREKRAIAEYAAQLVNEGDTLFINSGTTSLYLASEIKRINNILVITNSPLVAQELGYSPFCDVILLGGNYSGRYRFTYGDDAANQLGKYRADKFFLSCDGLHEEAGITTYHHLEADINRQFMQNARLTIAVADFSKIGKVSRIHVNPIQCLDTLVTNQCAKQDTLDAIRALDVDIICV
ncbi:MAG: DeoR/GlpR family DNA-binding transcription regulator [Clostridiaceae bacterium]|nr:DeoR/GlpR family DNA-binding transcription regulator [Clostridiaceae bacterium]